MPADQSEKREAKRLRKRIVFGLLAGFLAAVLLVVFALRSCNEPQAASSIDRLFGRSSSAETSDVAAPTAETPAKPGRPKPAVAKLLDSGSRTGRKVVAVAFQLRAVPGDPGGVDSALLDALSTDDAPATFFMAGLWAQAHRDVAARIAKMPRIEIGNGGYSAEYLRGLEPSVVRDRTKLAQDAIRSATGETPTLYRSAQTDYSPASIAEIAALGLRPVKGDVDLTSANPKLSAVGVSQEALTRVHAGSIVVLPGDAADPRTVRVFVRLLAGLKRQGYQLVPVSALAE